MQKIYGEFQSGTRFIEKFDQKYQDFFLRFFKKFHAYCATHLLLHRNESKKLGASGARRGNLEWNWYADMVSPADFAAMIQIFYFGILKLSSRSKVVR